MNDCLVVGGGPGALALAAYLIRKGHAVNLYNRSPGRISSILSTSSIQIRGVMEGNYSVKKAGSDIDVLLNGVRYIFIVVPGHAQVSVARLLSPYLSEDSLICLLPGRTFGSLEFSNEIKKTRPNFRLRIAESQTIPFTCRLTESGESHIFTIKNCLDIAPFPAINADWLHEFVDMLPNANPVANTLITGLNNVGALLHPGPFLLNLGMVENTQHQFKHYYDGITRDVARLIQLIDEERLTIGATVGVQLYSLVEWFSQTYGSTGNDLYELIKSTNSYETIDAPKLIDHRYLNEDVPTGLVPMIELSRMMGLDSRLMNAIVVLASALVNKDFMNLGRNFTNLGLSLKSVDELHQIFEYGFK